MWRRRGWIFRRSLENGRKKVGKNQGKSLKQGKMEENCEKTIKIEEKMNGKLGKTKEIEETVGNSGKTVGTQEKV